MKFAIIGCGRISIKHLEAITKIDESKLCAVCDINKDRGKQSAEKYKVPYYVSYDNMIKKEKPDIICLLTESGNHYKHALDLLKYKKPIIIEKPLCLSFKNAKDLVEKYKQAKVPLFAVKQNRYNTPILELYDHVQQNKLGKIFSGSCITRWSRNQEYYDSRKWFGTKSLDGGVFANQGIHYIDILQFFLGKPISVFAKTQIYNGINIETENFGVAIIQFEQNRIGTIEITTASQPCNIEGSLSILGTKGCAKVGGHALNKWEYFHTDQINNSINKKEDFALKHNNDVWGKSHLDYIKSVLNDIKNETQYSVTGEKVLNSIKILEAIYISAHLNKEVFLDEI